ncbi:hypothetical protein [Xanthobacter autotrophicus]|uniref:Autotransporter domain-containing protein n=1 Tax=Xanthobacter autotrophicus TaxID=280 RepID=A0A6C1KE40_XANAU|nr:hypothetical protein [Xanthobacter autotrophicus]TLX41504.1 hypothetical protein FBQ73_18785 [Xanthobacter autotrophicus]
MANTGGTILSGASGEISLRHRRTRALLLSSALVPALAVGALLVPTAAEAACNNAINPFGNATLNCNSGAALGVIGTAGNNLTVNLTNGANVGGAGIVGSAGNNIIVNTSGTTTSAGLLNGMSYDADGDITITNFSSTTSGGVNGLVLTADGDINLNGFKGQATGVLGDGISATAGGNITANNFTTPASGSAPHISGLINGLRLETDVGNISVQNFATSAQGGVTGINASTSVGNINLSGFSGSSNGVLFDGIQAQTAAGNIDANNFASTALVTGGVNGLDLSASVVGNINVNNFAGTAQGTLGAGILAQTAQGDINVNSFSGTAQGGLAGLALTTDNGDINVIGFSGTAQGTLPLVSSGIFGSADEVITVATTGNANISGGLAGINLVQRGDDVNVTLGGATQVSAGPLGFGVLVNSQYQANGNVDVNTAGGTTVSGGLAGIAINKTSIGGDVTVNTNGIVTGTSGVGIGVNAVIDQSTTTNITSSGTTSGGLGGIAASTTSVFGNATSTIDTYGPVSGGAGVAITGLATAQSGGKNATSTVEQHGIINNSAAGILASATAGNIATTNVLVDNTIDVTGFGVTALASGKSGSVTVETTTAGIITSGGFGILAGATGNDFTVDVTTNAAITAGSQGIIAGLSGNDGKVTVITNDTIGAGSQGIAAGIIGNNGTLDVTTNAAITAGSQGIVAGILGNDGTVTVTNKATINSVGSGIIAFNSGGDTTVNVQEKISSQGLFGAAAFAGGTGDAILNVNAVIDPPVIGGAAVTFGSGLAQANVNANVQATGIGILAGNVGTGDIDVNIFAGAPIQSDGIGISTFKVGDSGATTIDVDSAIGGLSQAATGGDGITAVAISLSPTANTPITINTTANGTINAGDDGISVNLLGGGDVNVTTNALVTAGDDGIQVRSIALSTGNVTVTNEAAVNAGDNGIFILKGGDGDVTVNANANISAATGNGIEANALGGTGNVTVALKDATTITADDIGIIASKSFGTGDVKVTIGEGSTIDANLGGIVALKAFGDSASGTAVLVETGKNSSITATNGIGITAGQGFGDGNLVVTTGEGSTINAGLGGIVALKLFGDSATVGGDAVTVTTGKNSAINTAGVGITAGQSFGDGNVVVTTGEGSTIGSLATPTFAGIIAGKAFGDGNLTTTTGLNSIIFAGTNGITSAHLFGTGDNTVTTGENSAILAGNDGIYATSLFTTGATNVTTGTNSLVSALDDGIVANKFGGSGDVSVTVGSTGSVEAGDDGIRVSNRSFGAGDIYVNVLGGTSVKATQVIAGDDAIHAHGWDNVNVTTGSYALIIGDADENGVGNAIRISDADIATVSIGANNVVSGSGQTWSNAVISVRSDDATNITVGADSLVSSWAYAFHGDVVTAASQIVIDTDGGATTIDNFGTIVGRVGLTGNDDVFNNYSSNTWVTVGNNYFGGGTDAINNPGRIVTALQGAVAETTSFYSLETFNNGDGAYVGAGLLDLRDEAPGQIAWNGARDVTYVSGVFHGVGNSTVGLDSFLGAAGSTSDILQVGGRDVNGDAIAGLVTPGQTALLIHDVNTGAGAWNLAGIKVVDVVDPAGVTYGKNTFGETPSFVISSASANYSAKFGGVIDKGLFFYDLVAIGNDQYLIGLPDQEVFELPKLVTGAQSVWHETTGVWLDRQADLRTYLQGTTTTLVTKEGVKTVNGAPASVTPGVWGKVVGSWGSRDASDSYSAYGRNYSFDTGYDQNTYGFMAGADFGKEGVFGPNDAVVFGVLGGYLTSDLSFSGSPSTADYSGGTVGVYATYINNNWYLDALFKADFLSMDYQAPTLVGAGYFGQSPDAKNYGFVIDTGYRFYKWGATGFVDGLATLSYVNTNISDLTIASGTLVDFGNNDSLRGSVGLRVGANAYDAATYRVEASLTGRLWYEFLGDNAVTIYNPGLPFTTVDTFDGLFGEVGVGLNFFAKDSGWNGFTNADIKFGDSYVAGSAKGGVRYQW